MTLRPPISRPGGKTRLLKQLLPLLEREHTCYVEVFGGGAALLLAKPKSKVEVYNDADGELVNVFRQVRHHAPEIQRELQWAINSRADMMQAKEQPGLTEIQRAARFIFRNAISFSGDNSSFGVVKTQAGGATTSLRSRSTNLAALHERLENVIIEHLPWQRVLKNYDAPATVLFLDPPYAVSNMKPYVGFNPEQLTELRDALRTVQGWWFLTLDATEGNRALFAEWPSTIVTHGNNFKLSKGAKIPTLLVTKS
jgi:DNA adenine methylase